MSSYWSIGFILVDRLDRVADADAIAIAIARRTRPIAVESIVAGIAMSGAPCSPPRGLADACRRRADAGRQSTWW
jgi:hypothetical protein